MEDEKPTFRISPKFSSDKLKSPTLEDKIDVFEDRMHGWILRHALALLDANYAGAEHAGMAALMLASSCLEPLGQFLVGKGDQGTSQQNFTAGFLHVFRETRDYALQSDGQRHQRAVKQITSALYSELRCGLFHCQRRLKFPQIAG